jgi:hypothetical protein
MQNYRAYIIGLDRHFIRSVELACDDDEAAKKRAQQLVDSHGVELWQRDRWIAEFAAEHADVVVPIQTSLVAR